MSSVYKYDRFFVEFPYFRSEITRQPWVIGDEMALVLLHSLGWKSKILLRWDMPMPADKVADLQET